jgi:hypothetical protein
MKKFVCEICRAERTRLGMLLHQRRFLQTWRAGSIDLRISRRDLVTHLELFDDRWHAYCGLGLFQAAGRQFVRELPRDLCPECRAVFEEQLAKIPA